MAELPRIYLIQESDAPQHSSKIENILTNLVTEKRIAAFNIQKPTADLTTLMHKISPGDMIISVLTEAMQSQKTELNQALKQDKFKSVKVAEIVIDHIPYDNEFITFPEDLKPIRSREDMDAVWNRIAGQLREIFPKLPEPEPEPEPEPPTPPPPNWKKYIPVAVLLLVMLVGYMFWASSTTSSKASQDEVVAATEAVDEEVIDNETFKMRIEDVFSISGRGTVVTGTIATGTVKEQQQLVITGGGVELQTMATGITISNKDVAGAKAGNKVGIILRGITKDQVRKGMILKSADTSELFVIVLQEIGAEKNQVIKVVRAFTGLGLKESKDLVESAPVKVWRTTSKGEARKIVQELKKAGAVVTVE